MLSSDWWVGLSASCDTKGAGHSSFCNWGTNSFNLSHVVCMRLLWQPSNTPVVVITSIMFFSDSGMASSYNRSHGITWSQQETQTNNSECCRDMRCFMVSSRDIHSTGNVSSCDKGTRCCRNTWWCGSDELANASHDLLTLHNSVATLIRVSWIMWSSGRVPCGCSTSRRQSTIGNSTCCQDIMKNKNTKW